MFVVKNISQSIILGLAILLFSIMSHQVTAAQSCPIKVLAGSPAGREFWSLEDGSIAVFGKMNINLDGYGRAYHPNNFAAGAVLHLCNAGKVYLADGTSYQGSESNAVCTGRFMEDFRRIRDAGWQDSSIGAINWYGVLGEGMATVHGKEIKRVKPVPQKDGSGFYVSTTAFFDASVVDPADQSRYVNPLHVPSAVVPQFLVSHGIAMGSFGVAIDRRKKMPVSFVVGDIGPRVGEGSVALARMVAGMPLTDEISRSNRYVGQVDTEDVLWVFFGGPSTKFDHNHEDKLAVDSKEAFQNWGGEARLHECLLTLGKN